MKTFQTLGLLAILVVLFSGCDKYNEKRFSTTIIYAFEVDIHDGESAVVDLDGQITSMVNSELEKVKDDIKKYELVSIDYQVFEFWGATPNTFTGTIGFGNANSINPGVNYGITGLDLEAQAVSSPHNKLNFNSMDISTIEQYFKDTNGLRIYLNGDAEQVPVHFKMQFSVNVDAIADVKKK